MSPLTLAGHRRWYDNPVRPWIIIAAALLAVPTAASAQPAPDNAPDRERPQALDPDDALLLSTGALDAKIAVMRFDALGMDGERVARLETLFRKELDRLSKRPLPSWATIDKTIKGSRALRRCGASNQCLAKIGRALRVQAVVSGNVAALGDAYILDIKVVNSKNGKQIRRISTDPLRGNPDELILSMREAAYKLLAPEQLLGSLTVLTDLIGATVKLDGKVVGKTPLPGPLYRLPLGEHKLEVQAKDFMPFKETVKVRFQKSTRVVVRLVTNEADDDGTPLPTIIRKRPAPKPWYTNKWVYIGVGVTAGLVGGIVGYRLSRDQVIDCGATPTLCSP